MFSVFVFAVAAAVFHLLKTVEIAHFGFTDLFEALRVKVCRVPLLMQAPVMRFALAEVFAVEADRLHRIELLHQFVEAGEQFVGACLGVTQIAEEVFPDLFKVRDVFLALVLFDLLRAVFQTRSILNLDGGPDGDMLPEVIHILVGNGDAAVGPVVAQRIAVAVPVAIPVRLGMNRNVGTGFDPEFRGTFSVFCVGIVEIECPVFDWMAALTDDMVFARRGTEIPFFDLWPFRNIFSQGYRHCLDHFPVMVQVHLVPGFAHEDAVDLYPFELFAPADAVFERISPDLALFMRSEEAAS